MKTLKENIAVEFQITGMILLSLFYICYFTKMIGQHRKGIRTNQIGLGKTGTVKRIEMALSTTSILVFIVEVASILRNAAFFSRALQIAGVFLGAIGVLVFWISVWTMRDSWRAGVPMTDQTELVTEGIYQISRNPAFLGFDLLYIGIAVMFFNWILFAATCLTIIVFHLQIVCVEEIFLLEAFGEEYSRYKKKVCRYLGRKIG